MEDYIGGLQPRKTILTCIFFGLIVGAISAVPILWIPNLCCLWIVFGGFISAYACDRGSKQMDVGDGFIIGALFGISYAVFNEFFYHIINAVLRTLGFAVASSSMTVSGFIMDVVRIVFLLVFNLVLSFFIAGSGGAAYVFIKPRGDESSRLKKRR
jgi:hypothetical protein